MIQGGLQLIKIYFFLLCTMETKMCIRDRIEGAPAVGTKQLTAFRYTDYVTDYDLSLIHI